MKKLLSTLLMTAVLIPQAASASGKDEVDAAFSKWREAISSGKAENVVKLYDKDAILLATLADKPITDQDARTNYFKTLTAKDNLRAEVTEKHVKLLDDNDAVISGLYTFKYDEKGKTIEIPARYSFVYKKEGDKWMIVDHHSSKVPQ